MYISVIVCFYVPRDIQYITIMKATFVFASCVSLCIAAPGSLLHTREEPSSWQMPGMFWWASWVMPSVSGKVRQEKPIFRNDTRRNVLRVGPYKLPAYKVFWLLQYS
jgi:hypothetical protein